MGTRLALELLSLSPGELIRSLSKTPASAKGLSGGSKARIKECDELYEGVQQSVNTLTTSLDKGEQVYGEFHDAKCLIQNNNLTSRRSQYWTRWQCCDENSPPGDASALLHPTSPMRDSNRPSAEVGNSRSMGRPKGQSTCGCCSSNHAAALQFSTSRAFCRTG